MFKKFKNSMKKEFDMSDLGFMKYFSWSGSGVKLSGDFHKPKEVCQ